MALPLRVISVVLASCCVAASGGAGYAGFPPLPGPSPDVEAVAVSSEIATTDRPVFYYRESNNPNRLLAYDWTGALRGTVTIAASEPTGVYPSADGTVLLVMDGHVTSGGRALGRLGFGRWAGDNTHVCAFLNTIGGPGRPRERQVSANEFEGIDTPGALYYEQVTGDSRQLLAYGQFGPHGGPAVLACSAGKDRAVIGGSFVATLCGLTMVRLSDANVLSSSLGGSHVGPDGTVVSADATLLALGSTGGVSQPGADAFTVFQIPSNRVVTQISGSGIEAFSADDSRVLTVADVNGSNVQRRYQLVELSTGREIGRAHV